MSSINLTALLQVFTALAFEMGVVVSQYPSKSSLKMLIKGLSKNHTSFQPGCATNNKCIYEFLFGDVILMAVRMILRQDTLQQPSNHQLLSMALDNENFSFAANASVSSKDNYSSCGVHPACTIRYLSENKYEYTCNRSLIIFAAISWVILSIIITGSNVLIIVVTLRTKSLLNSHGIFKLSLATADLIAGIFVLPSTVYNTLNTIDFEKTLYSRDELSQVVRVNITNINSIAAVLFGVMGILCTITAVYSLLFLSMDRYLAVSRPLIYRVGDIMNVRRAVFGVAFAWLFSGGVAFLPILAKEYVVYGLTHYTFMFVPVVQQLNSTSADAPIAQRYLHAILYSVFVWGLPFVFTWILTILTSIHVFKHRRKMRESRNRGILSSRSLDKVDVVLVRTITVVLTLFTITVLPVFGVNVAIVMAPETSCNSSSIALAFFITTYVLVFGRFFNAFIYNVFNKAFREATKKLLKGSIFFQKTGSSLQNNVSHIKITPGEEESSKSREKWESKETRETEV